MMKKIYQQILLLLLLAVGACSPKADVISVNGDVVTVLVQFPRDMSTRSVGMPAQSTDKMFLFQWDGTPQPLKVLFKAGDESAVAETTLDIPKDYNPKNGKSLKFEVTIPAALRGKTITQIAGVLMGGTLDPNGQVVVYPDAMSNGVQQTAPAINGGNKAYHIPFFFPLTSVAENRSKPIHFTAMGSLLRLELQASPEQETVWEKLEVQTDIFAAQGGFNLNTAEQSAKPGSWTSTKQGTPYVTNATYTLTNVTAPANGSAVIFVWGMPEGVQSKTLYVNATYVTKTDRQSGTMRYVRPQTADKTWDTQTVYSFKLPYNTDNRLIEMIYQDTPWKNDEWCNDNYLGYGYTVTETSLFYEISDGGLFHFEGNTTVKVVNNGPACEPHKIELKLMHTNETSNGKHEPSTDISFEGGGNERTVNNVLTDGTIATFQIPARLDPQYYCIDVYYNGQYVSSLYSCELGRDW